MARYEIITLVDITRHNITRSETDKVKIGQQANFNSLIQAIGLRANIGWHSEPAMKTGTLPNPFKGKATYWTWIFETEREDEFLKDNDPVGFLMHDLHGVPIIDNLRNSADIYPAAFQTTGDNVNTTINIIL
jgi:hypothetical protein